MAGAEPFLAGSFSSKDCLLRERKPFSGKFTSSSVNGNQELFPCEVCGRRFAADVLERHGPICRKLFNKKRKPFNSLKQRLQGTDIPLVGKALQSKPRPVRKSDWRQQHEDFINALRSAKQCTLAIKEGRPLPPPPPPSINPDYIQCPYCMRRFNETAASQHINFCKDQSSRRVFDPAQTAAKLASRAQGRAQTAPKKEPTVTSAVGALLHNRALEASSVVPTRPGLAVDPASGAKLRQGFTKSSRKD
ncbi:zinc finger C2HC domain-containing protein 1B isoform X1 [Equus przewalskii]|uniref:Zinc finger C2HC-type containing 1B n=2 Tax=Equus TaxID=9789 RepID=A0A9L0R806_HORSE|nr:PREDICTED: zinc finger C2HC domain-containing protein 1B isoform X1 [Equus przewalskii]XP_008529832.1 PREDICTED: zinc finger C2HC domain-containing protein 1B isoform X1 [Equus przewalskii]XP_008529841.1 PREDICTED: zinc finger C2HC domain-containing protein 1B isoform X1 [Equus przewalskii]XP_008529848.1 PREDICTED: zinc finger C2HC domain-containing protein 1B isoform X1 [Equus przewalskii]XP_008529857.1 PREDICTED: zinc finger C2HC domain-containing protein 1B isoform X1 [Equus przewalskii]